ncbi:MAG: PH domain-containing protein [Halococcoides sp.]
MSTTADTEEAASFDWLTLDEDEKVLWVGEPHVASIVPALAVGVVLSIVLIGIPIIVAAYLGRQNTVFLMTTDGLYHKKGILSRDVQKIGFEKIQNISFSQGALGASIGYGTVDISTAGGSGVEMQFRGVEEPKSVQEQINRRIRQTRGEDDREGPSKDDVLTEILGELRAIRSAVERDGAAADDGTGGDERTVEGWSQVSDDE